MDSVPIATVSILSNEDIIHHTKAEKRTILISITNNLVNLPSAYFQWHSRTKMVKMASWSPVSICKFTSDYFWVRKVSSGENNCQRYVLFVNQITIFFFRNWIDSGHCVNYVLCDSSTYTACPYGPALLDKFVRIPESFAVSNPNKEYFGVLD
jgi:hypothetical protein